MTGIEWTDETWNPTVGCSVVSPGCTNCYAMRLAHRMETDARPAARKYWGLTRTVNGNPVWTGTVRVVDRALNIPLGWSKPRKIFVNSMSDLFHKDIAPSDIARIWAIMALTPRHTYQVLTKRPENAVAWLDSDNTQGMVEAAARQIQPGFRLMRWPLAHVWVGTSVEDQDRAMERVPIIARALAEVRFLSVEPLLAPIRLLEAAGTHAALKRIGWVIVGGETGQSESDARPMHPDWARSLRDECRAHGIAFFFKQVGSWAWVSDDEATEWISPDGKVSKQRGGQGIRYGAKEDAGRQLDGKLHEEMPCPSNQLALAL